ncbi:MAG TPA: permease-like cell division protein FtsX [Solirubrobacteraceae bacterium]|nr:permease-like cell division protein FtsX [Solirubrobacteraceae bacterium]
MKLGFFLKEATRSIGRNPAPSFAALSCVLVTTLVLGVFIPVVQATNGAANSIRGRVVVDVDLNTTATAAEVARVHKEVERVRYAGHVEVVSKQAGYEQEKKIDPQAFQLIGYNPLPEILRITPSNPEDADALRSELDQSSPIGKRLVTDNAIAAVQNRQGQTDKILTATRIVKITMALLAGLLIFSSMLLVSNTIRLSLFARRREVEVMKLVGATDWFIRWPFVIEGLFLGALGGVCAIALLALAKVTLIDPLAGTVKLISQPAMIDFRLLIVVLMACAIAVSAAGSGISLRRFLRV